MSRPWQSRVRKSPRYEPGMAQVRVLVSVLAALAGFILHPSALILVAQPACYPPEQAAAHVGETACIEGLVTNAIWAERSNGRPTFLDFGTSFTVVIWEEDRPKFNPAPETRRGQRLRVQGLIETFRGKAQIVVRNPSQLGPAGMPLAVPAATTVRAVTPAPTTTATQPASTAPPGTMVVTATPAVAPSRMAPAATVVNITPASPSTPEPSPRATEPADAAATGDKLRWPLVAAGFGLIGVGVAGAAWYGLRRRTP